MHLDQYIMTISYFCCMLLPNQIVSFLKAYLYFGCQWASLVAQMVKNLPAMQETWVQSLGREDPWRREQQPTPVFSSGESHGQRSLAGYSPRGHKELSMTEVM